MYKFENLQIWQDAINYGKEVYKVTEKLPKAEIFGLGLQLKRAVVSISSNIAEGSGTSSNKFFAHYVDIAMSSTIETISQLKFAKELGYIDNYNLDLLYQKSEVLMRKMQAFKKSLSKL